MFANDGADVYSVDISSTWLIRAGPHHSACQPASQPPPTSPDIIQVIVIITWSSCSNELGYADVRAYCGLYTRLSRWSRVIAEQ
jgi:hypothetical protein